MAQAIFEKKNILVTGGAGFIGSHLCDELVKRGKVICIDNFVSGDSANIDHLLQNENFIFINQDISKPFQLTDFPELERFRVEFQGVQEIYHLACPTSPKNFEQVRVETMDANSVGTKNLLEMAKLYNSKFLMASSSVVYGPRKDDNPHVHEDMIGIVDQTSPRAVYDLGKKFAETMVLTYHEMYKLRTRIARIFRTYGPRQMLKDGRMIPDFIENALDNNELVIFGDETFSTSLCYISDCVDGLIRLMESNSDHLTVNIGSDQNLPLSEVAQKVIELTGSSSNLRYEPPLLFMTPLSLPVITKAKDEFGWIPIVTLEKGLIKTIDYAKAERSKLRPDT
jgi:nucleoside-diphosphate-sugar epimerase